MSAMNSKRNKTLLILLEFIADIADVLGFLQFS